MELLQDDFRIDYSFSESGDDQQKQSKNPLIQCGFTEEQARHVRKLGFHHLTTIQLQALPLLTVGVSAIIISRTGSGKTLAYTLPLLKNLVRHRDVAGIRALILSPTRELAFQISRVIKQVAGHGADKLRVALLSGGDSLDAQFDQLSSNPDVVVATPGRLQFHMEQIKHMNQLLQAVEYLVIDEADQMFENQLLPQVSEIIARLPHPQTVLCSATLPPQLSDFTAANMRNAKLIQSEAETLPEELTQVHLLCNERDKAALLAHMVRDVFPRDWRVLVFVSTRYHAEFLSEALRQQKISTGALYGTLDQEARHHALASFMQRRTQLLICTDVAARGVDIEHLECVVNFNFPFSARTYLHRGGRAARAGRYGLYVNLLDVSEIAYLLDALLHAELPVQNMAFLRAWERISRKFLSFDIALTCDSLQFRVASRAELKHNMRKFIEAYANENHAKLQKHESAEALRTRFVNLYNDVRAIIDDINEEDIPRIATYLQFLKNLQLLKISPYSAAAFLGKHAQAMSSVIGTVPQAVLDAEQRRFDFSSPELEQLCRSMKNSIQQLNKQRKSATFQSCSRATEIAQVADVHPLFAHYIKGEAAPDQGALDVIKNFKISTQELQKKASVGDENAAVQLRIRELIERKKKLRNIVVQEVFGDEEEKPLLQANSAEIVRQLDEKVKRTQAQHESREELIALKPQRKELQIKDIAIELPRDEMLADGVQKKVWDKVKGRWVTQASLMQPHEEKTKMEMTKEGKWKAVPKTKQFYEKWMRKTGQKVQLPGQKEVAMPKKSNAKLTTQYDKDMLEAQLSGKKKRKETTASKLSNIAQRAAAKGKDWRKEADRRRAKGTRKEDNLWRKSIKKNK